MDYERFPFGHGGIPGRVGRSIIDRIEVPVAAIAYWAAIGLPVGYLALLATGIDSGTELGLFLGLFGVHVAALIGGRNYEPGTSRIERP